MNVQEYIKSGILEAYVKEELSDAEKVEVEKMVEKYPEVRDALNKLEPGMSTTQNAENTDDPIEQQLLETEQKLREDKILKKMYFWRALAIFSAVFFIGAMVLYSINRSRTSDKIALQNLQNSQLFSVLKESKSIMEQQQAKIAILQSPDVRKIILSDGNHAGGKFALLYWNASNNKLWLNADELPAPQADKQYQLWALQGNNYSNLGTIEENGIVLQQMKSVQGADAFMITLEPLGGSVKPTMEEVKVSVKM